ncbi:alcohol dehydrogenase, partial [bacterium]|nr:alcohol dehydrogenase [bacterium]
MTTVNAWAAQEAGGKLEPFTYELGQRGAREVEIEADYCGL